MGTNNSQETKATLILGGTGKTGRRVVERRAAYPCGSALAPASHRSTGRTRRRGCPRCGMWSRCRSPITRTSRYRARWRWCVRSPSWLPGAGCGG